MNTPATRWMVVASLLLFALVLAAADLFVVVGSVILVTFAGFLFAIFLHGISAWVAEHTPLRYRWSYAILVLLLVAAMAGGVIYMGSTFFQHLSELSGQLREAGQQAMERLQQYEWVQRLWPDDGGTQDLVGQFSDVFPQVMTALQALGWGVTGLIVIFFVGVYVAYDPDLYREGLVKVFRMEHRERARRTIGTVRATLGWWLLGRIISMTIIGVATAIGLWLLGVPLPLSLGVLAAFLTFIPNIGPVLAAVPQALLALQVGTNTVLYVILFNLALQTVESYMITPIVQRYEVTLPPALTIFAQLVMTVTFGVIGIVMAAPLTAMTLVLVQTLYIRDRLGDERPGELAEST